MAFGIGNLFDPLKMAGTSLFGGPKGSPSWGQIPTPGAPQQPLGLLHAGDDDMQPPPMPGGTGNLPLSKAGLEGPGAPPAPAGVGPSRGLQISPIEGTPGNPGAASGGPGLHPTEAPLQPPGASPLPPGATTPTLSPQYTPTPPQSGESSQPLQAPYQAPAPSAAPAAAPAAGGGHSGPAQTGAPGGMSKLGDVGKALAAAGGQQAGQRSGSGGLGSAGAPFSPNGSALMAEVMKLHPPGAAGPVPGLPPGLLQRFRT